MSASQKNTANCSSSGAIAHAEKCFNSVPGALGPVTRGNETNVPVTKCYDRSRDYTSSVNDWLHRTPYYSQQEEYKEQRYEKGKTSVWECSRRIVFQHGVLRAYGWGASKKEARNRADHSLSEQSEGSQCNTLTRMQSILRAVRDLPKVQMDGEVSKESNQGLAVQESTKDSNTIITRDEGETITHDTDNQEVSSYLSAEKVFQFHDLIGRWMPLATLEVTTEKFVGDVIATYYLPESLFTAAACAPNLVPFEAFIYSQLDIEMRFVVNAQKFQCGKVVVSVKFDSYQADAMQATAMAALNRPHIILDLASNNQGVLQIPFRYHRGFVRNVKNDANSQGVRPSKYASVYVQYLSPLRTGANGSTNMFITPFYRFTRSKFAAMSYRVKVQMDLAQDVIDTAYQASGMKQMLRKFENMTLQFGRNNNMDKPVNYESNIFIPRPRLNFGTGRGLSDAQPLRINPLSLTSQRWIKPFEDEPQTTTQIARVWGLRDTFVWTSGNAPNTELWKSTVDPTSRTYTGEYQGTPSPLEYICGLYNFWSGSLEYRFDFVSNAFHTGAVMISIEFGRPVTLSADGCTKASTYTKTFHLGDQKSVTITVPYIYDTVMRRSTGSAYNPNFTQDSSDRASDTTRYQAMGLRPESKTIIRVSVINDLRPIQTTSQEIDVLVFIRGGSTFVPHSLKQMSYVLTRESSGLDPFIDSFPRDNYKVNDDTLRKRRSAREVHDYLTAQGRISTLPVTPKEITTVSHKYLPKEVRNEWNEYAADKFSLVKPQTQADRGEKEDEDPTEDFSAGQSLLKLQTSDVQTNIKDILRRPVLLVFRQTVNSVLTKGENFFVPVMPPCREFNYHTNQSTIFNQLVGQTPQAALMNLFRFWRGSSRYTVFVHSGSAEPIFISYVPHTGTRILGNQIIGNELPANSSRSLMSAGFATEPIIPLVNPSAVVEVPYDTENFWTLTFEEDTQRNYAWRDKGDTNAGHLVVTATTDIQISIWWSAGDDFEVANFYGIPECYNRDATLQWSDAHGRVQMDEDFQSEERGTFSSTLSQIKGEISKLADPRILVKAAIGSIPLVGPAAVGAPVVVAMEKLAENSTHTLSTLDRTLSSVEGAASTMTQVTQQLAPLISTIHNFIGANNVGGDIRLWSERLIDFLTDLSVAWYQKSWVQVGITCFKMLARILIVDISKISDYLSMFTGAVLSLVGPARVQAPSTTATIVGALAGIVGLALGVKICQDNYKSYTASLSRAFFQTSGISYINQVIRFVQTVFDILRDMIMEALGYKSPEAVALRMLSGRDLILKNFIMSAQSVINEANSTMVLHPTFRTKFWYTVTQAYQIQQVLTLVPSNVVSPQLGKLCSEVIKVGNERMMDLSCSPVRYEPFVICIEGPHGIGKSHLTDKLISHLLKAVGFERAGSGWTYTRAPGSKYWSGYRDQPAIIYDDWLNLNDAQLMSQQISELYQLKSTSTFIPEMAHLEEKRIKANPMLVVLLTNGAFPSGMANVAHHPQAVYRRRDIVLHASVAEGYVGKNPRDLSEEESMRVAHLKFQKYGNACDRTTLSSGARNWTDTVKFLAEKFQRYHAQEELNVRSRVEILREQLQVGANETFDFEDPFSLLYKATDFISTEEMGTNAWLPSEQLEAAVTEIVEQVQRRKQQNIPIIVPPDPDDIFVQFDCCPTTWTEMAQWFAKGVLITPELWAKMSQWTLDGLSACVSKITEWTHIPFIGECCVCNETKELTYACADSGNMHKVCFDCWNNVCNLSPTICCPICRSGSVGLFLQRDDGLLATILVWCANLAENMAIPAIRLVTKLLSRMKTRAMSKLILLGELILGYNTQTGVNTRRVAQHIGQIVTAEIIHPNETFYDALSEMGETAAARPIETALRALVVPAIDISRHDQQHQERGEWNYRLRSPITQSDDEWDTPPPRDIRQRPSDPLGSCELNLVGFSACRVPKVTILPQCYHQRLSDNIDTIIYRDSQVLGPAWQVPIDINGRVETIMILDNPCQHNCIWEDEEVHKAFCEYYIRRHQAQIARAQIMYAGALQSNPIEFLKSIPRFARPAWAAQEALPVPLAPDNWWTYLSDTWVDYKNMLVITGLIAGTMGAVYLTYTQISSWFLGPTVVPNGSAEANEISYWPMDRNSTPVMFQSDPNYNPEHQRFIQRADRIVRPTRMPRTQGDNLADTVEGYICKNYVRIIVGSGQRLRYLTAIGIYNHYAAIPRHYVRLLANAQKENKTIHLAQALVEWAGSKYSRQEYTFDIADFIISPVSDIAYFRLPASFNMFKDIRKFLSTQRDINNYISSEGKIIIAPTRENQIPQVVPIQIKGYQQSEIFEDYDNTSFEAFHVLRYTYSKQGACGSVVCLENSQRPILAMHCAGQGEGVFGVGWGVLLTQESVAEMLPDNIVVQCEERDHLDMDQAKFVFDEACQITYIGTVAPHQQPHIPQKTKIEKSLLHNRFGFKALTEPTILCARDPRHTHEFSPLYLGVRKHGIKTRDFPSSKIERAGEALWDRWLSRMEPIVVSPKRLTFEQAILGFEGNKYYDALSLNTSAGYPWNMGVTTTKEAWITVDWENRTCDINSNLLNELLRKEELRRQGIVPETIFVDTLKDERKKSEKITKPGATRVFCASPVDYTIALRQNLLHFCAAFMKHRHELMHAVGIDVHGEEWARLWSRLTKHGTKFVGLDYSNFGPAFNACIAAKASELMRRWTLKYVVSDLDKTEWERELDALNWECDHSLHLCGNVLYRQTCGSPSGASITVIKNSVVNLLYILCAWEALSGERAKDESPDIWKCFQDNVELCVYGDDLIMTVADEFQELFNTITIQNWFSKYGIVSTDASKSDTVEKFTSKEKITFLKRGWARHPTRPFQYLAPLDMVSINDITQWIWRSPDRREATRVNCESALLEAHSLGPQMYEQLRAKINAGLEKLGIDAITMNWYDVDNKYYSFPVEVGSCELWG